jgi:hypothetical protein
MDQLEGAAEDHLHDLLAEPGISLVQVPFQNPYIQLLWRQHYVGSKGTVGRQLHYIIYYNGKAVGAISAGSAMFAHKKRDKLLQVTKEERQDGIRHIVNNTMFRLTRPKEEPPKATEVLALFRKTIIRDWLRLYGDYVRAFETLVEPPRWGGIYKLDGWKKIGITAGLGARRPEGHGTAGKQSTGRRKIIRVPKKIVWVLPICSYEEAIKRSVATKRNTYGDDARQITGFLQANARKWFGPGEIAAKSGVPIERTKTLLYLMVNADGEVIKNSEGKFRVASREKVIGPHLYSKPTQRQLECQQLSTIKS